MRAQLSQTDTELIECNLDFLRILRQHFLCWEEAVEYLMSPNSHLSGEIPLDRIRLGDWTSVQRALAFS